MLSLASSFAVSFLVRLAMDVFQSWRVEATAKAAGRGEAIAEGERAARASVIIARDAEVATIAQHRADASDSAFDLEFRRD